MIPLIDSDVLRYEVGFAAETGWQSEGFVPFDYVAQLLDERINNICAMVGATAPPILFLTGKGNFRNEIAVTQPYKNRPSVKPWHFKNITAYLLNKYDVRISEGMEADDCMSIEQTKVRERFESNPFYSGTDTIICSRDKDLRTVPGWFFSWELGNQPSFGPEFITKDGWIKLSEDRKKLRGVGDLFFYAQCLMGDSVDSIPGLGGKTGPVKAFEILKECATSQEAFKAVREAYRTLHEDGGDKRLLEQARLLNMSRKLDGDKILLWSFPDTNYEEWLNVNTKEITRTSPVLS